MEDNQLENEKSFRRYSVYKQILDIAILVIILASILTLCFWDKISSEGAAGLIGATIGYVLSDFKKRVSN